MRKNVCKGQAKYKIIRRMRMRKKVRKFISVLVILAAAFSVISIMFYDEESISVLSKYGSRGAEVTEIQTRLKRWGYYDGNIDGIYGTLTKNAVIKFQKKNGLTADGIAGPKTLAAMGIYMTSSSSNRQNEINLLARLISAEARGEPYVGQVAVGAVVLNRVKHPSFPNTMSGVIYQSGAFSSVNSSNWYQPVSSSCYKAAEAAMNGWDPTGGSIYFFNPAKTSNAWMHSLPRTAVIGNHVFSTGK